MLINKENTKYGYKARIRYDVKAPIIHVIEKDSEVKIRGEADLTVITGQASIQRQELEKKVYDKIMDKETYRVAKETEVLVKAMEKTVMIEDNSTKDSIENYLKLTVTEDEPSSEDLQYIEEE